MKVVGIRIYLRIVYGSLNYSMLAFVQLRVVIQRAQNVCDPHFVHTHIIIYILFHPVKVPEPN